MNNLSKSDRIATKQAIHLKAVGLQPSDRKIDQTIGQTQTQV